MLRQPSQFGAKGPRATVRYKRSRGMSLMGIIVTTAIIATTLGAGLYLFRSGGANGDSGTIETVQVRRGQFLFTVTEKGEVESSNSVEIRCEVKARNSAGTTIIDIVPEGTFVKKDKFLVKLDSSALELDLNSQKILVHNSNAAMIQAENVYETAKIAKTEYQKGSYKQEEQTIRSELFVAQENLNRAREYLKYTERLFSRGYATALQVDADRFAVEKSKNELAAANTKLEVLREFTKAKMLTQLQADIQSAYAKWQSAKSSYELDLAKQRDIESQIAACTIVSPIDGQVKYANKKSHRGSDVVIEPGVQVQQGQVIIKIPDPTKMEVEAEITEDLTKHVKAGMAATIVIGSVSQQQLTGRVVKVNDYPEPTSFFGSNVKKYETTIDIVDPPNNIRPGLTATVTVAVAKLPDALQVPLPSVVEHGDQFYCIVQSENAWSLRKVEVGLNNDRTVVIRSGLQPDDTLVANPRAHRQLVEWPDLREQTFEPEAENEIPQQQSGKPDRSSDGKGGGQRGEQSNSPQRRPSAAQIFSRLDQDGDGKISAVEMSELPAEQRGRISAADANGDGSVDQAELKAAFAAQRGGGR
jgi:multidrug resistance efflux pump